MASQTPEGVWVCAHCGLTAPRGHWRPKTWIEKHEMNCASNPKIKMKSFSEFNKETVDEGVGLAVARAIDKTNPPLGRPSRRRAVS